MPVIQFKAKVTEIGDSTTPMELDLDTITGKTVTGVTAINTVKLNDLEVLVTIGYTAD